MLNLYKINAINNECLAFLVQREAREFNFLTNSGETSITHNYNIDAFLYQICGHYGIEFDTLNKTQQKAVCASQELFYELANAFGLEQAQSMLKGQTYRYKGDW